MARSHGKSGRTFVQLLVLLGLLGGYGSWNYHRNLEAENAEYRPYRGYSKADLDALSEAYRAEIEQYRQRYETASGGVLRIREGANISQKIREFERVQRISRATRELGARLSERDAALRQIDLERARRGEQSDRLATFLRRAVIYRPSSESSSSSSSS